jgi:hypothetical protein
MYAFRATMISQAQPRPWGTFLLKRADLTTIKANMRNGSLIHASRALCC